MAMRLMRWLLTVGVMAGSGACAGWAIGLFLAGYSTDYLVVPSWYTGLGLRLGLLSGTFLAACQVVTDRPLPSAREVLHGYLLLIAVSGLLFCLAMGGAVIVANLKEPLLRQGVLAHPRRYILYRGCHYAWLAAVLCGTVVSGVFLYRKRPAAPSRPDMGRNGTGRMDG